MLTEEQSTRYSRHIFLPEIGLTGQQRLCAAKVLLIGMGGLGSAAAYYLAASGVGTLYLSDNELVELSNLQRQILYRVEDVGSLKTQAAQKNLLALNPSITIIPVAGLSTASNSIDLNIIQDVDVILDCTDNFPTRYAINALCVKYRKALISGSALGWQGQVGIFPLQHITCACYACLYPLSAAGDVHQPRCADSGVVSPLVGIIGNMQALETIKLLLNPTGNTAKLYRYHAAHNQLSLSIIQRDSACCHHA